jgi:thiol-disulfide isomerase/thioredoxin
VSERTFANRKRAWPVLVAVGLCGLVGVVGCGDRAKPRAAVAGTADVTESPPAAATLTPLVAGNRLPPLSAAGWIHGQPSGPAAPGVRLVLVDLWSNWCPFCRSNAPELVRLHQKFSVRGVSFVSLTTMDHDAAESFVNQFGISWPCGYGAAPEVVLSLGAAAGSGIAMPGEEIAPTIYLVGPDGRVRWTDGQGRFHHEGPEKWGRTLEAAVEAELGGAASNP